MSLADGIPPTSARITWRCVMPRHSCRGSGLKLRKKKRFGRSRNYVSSPPKLSGKRPALQFPGGFSASSMDASHDSLDIMTEVINRAEPALEAARSAPNKVAAAARAVA